MAGSIIAAGAAHVESTELATWRNWDSHPCQGAFWLISCQTSSESLGETQLCKRPLFSKGPGEQSFYVKKAFSTRALCCLGGELAVSPLAPRWLTMLKS